MVITLQEKFPSGFFYINGVIYSDMRDMNSIDYADSIIKWAKRYDSVGQFHNMEIPSRRPPLFPLISNTNLCLFEFFEFFQSTVL